MRKLWRHLTDAIKAVQKSANAFLTVAWPIFRPVAPAISVVLACILIEVILENAGPMLWGRLTDALVGRHGTKAVQMLLVLLVLDIVTRSVYFARENFELRNIDWTVNLNIMNRSIERLLGFSMAQASQAHSGKTRDVIRNGRNAMQQLVFLFVYRLGPTLLELAATIGALMWFNRLIGLSCLGSSIAYLVFSIALFMHHRKPLKELEERGNENGKMFADILSNMDLIMANARQRRTAQEFADDGEAFARQGRTFWIPALRWMYMREGFNMLCTRAITALIAFLFFQDAFSFGMFVAMEQWAWRSLNASRQLGQMQRELSKNWAQMELYLELLRQPPDIVVTAHAIQPERLSGNIEFRGVTFQYEPRKNDRDAELQKPTTALDDVTFHIPAGQKVALVGESGAGKSTVAYALMRAKDPESGSISIDGIDIRDLDLNGLRVRVGYVAQEPQLFDQSLRYNLTFGLNGHADLVTDEELIEALTIVRLEHLANDGGLESKLGEKGHTLSGGEKQRLCIARALIKSPNLLIFDEATSSLDPVNEKKVQDAIDAVDGRTRLIIAHRYSTIRNVDRILVFEKGKLVADGTHKNLLERCAYYRALLEQQGLS